jgi:predicted metalloprotease
LSNQQPYGGSPPPPPYNPPPQQSGAPAYGGRQYGGQPYGGPPSGGQRGEQFNGPQFGGQQFAGPQFGGPSQGGPQQGGPQPGFGWGPQFPAGPGGFQRAPKNKRRAAWVAVPIIGVFAVMVGLWVLGSVAEHTLREEHVTRPVVGPSHRPGAQGTPTNKPTAGPTKTAPTTPPRQPTPSEVVSRDSFYFAGLQRTVNCRESSARASSVKAAATYYGRIKSCLDRAWPRQLELAKDQFRAPHLIAMTGPMQTPCSGGAPSSFYCSANETIYMDAIGDVTLYAKYRTYSNRTQALTVLRMDMADTVAHEYGHHVQFLSGILKAATTLEYERSGDASLQVSRRVELQASCLGNVFLGMNKNTYPIKGAAKTQLDWLHAHQGDEYGPRRDHGSRKVVPYWTGRGWKTHNNASCNTFTASSNLVR